MGRGAYNTVEFWDEWYQEPEHANDYDWLVDYHDVGAVLEPLLRSHDARILVVGCGNSPLSSELFSRGFRDVTSVDNCASVIEEQRRRCPMLRWSVADCRRLPFDDGAFDVILDKGLVDNLYCYESPDAAVQAFVDEARRVLAPSGGRYVLLSCHDFPQTVRTLQRRADWTYAVGVLPNPRYPRINIPNYHIAIAERGRDVATSTAALARALEAPGLPEAPRRIAHLESRASARRHSAIIAASSDVAA